MSHPCLDDILETFWDVLWNKCFRTGTMETSIHAENFKPKIISWPELFCKIGVLKNFANFIGKHLCGSLFNIVLQPWRRTTLLKRDSNTGVFLTHLRTTASMELLNFYKFLFSFSLHHGPTVRQATGIFLKIQGTFLL